MYNKFTYLDSLYDKVDTACTRIENDIYQGLLMDLKLFYHEGIIKNQKGNIPDSEYQTARNDSGYIHAKIRNYVYNFYFDINLDNFTLYTDLKKSFYNDDSKSSAKYISKFEKDTSDFIKVNKKYLR